MGASKMVSCDMYEAASHRDMLLFTPRHFGATILISIAPAPFHAFAAFSCLYAAAQHALIFFFFFAAFSIAVFAVI